MGYGCARRCYRLSQACPRQFAKQPDRPRHFLVWPAHDCLSETMLTCESRPAPEKAVWARLDPQSNIQNSLHFALHKGMGL